MRKFISVALMMLLIGTAWALPTEPQIDGLCRKAFPSSNALGGAVAVIVNGEVVHEGCYGLAKGAKGNVAVTPTTPFYLASVSKQFTAMCVMMLAEKGELKLDHDVREYLTDMPQFSGGRPILVTDLLTMRSGLPEYDLDDPNWNRQKMTTWLRTVKLDTPTGTHYEYINTNYALLGYLVEQVSGMSIKQFEKQAIFDALKMPHTTYADGETADGGVYSCLEDMITWERALRRCALVSEEMMKTALTRPHLDNGDPFEYAFGWKISADGTHASHNGHWADTSTYISIDLTRGESIIVLSNIENAAPELADAIGELSP